MEESTPMQNPALSILLSKFEKLNVELIVLFDDISVRINAIKQYIPVPKNGKPGIESTSVDVLSHFEQQLNELENTKEKFQTLFQHIQTIV